MGILATLVSFKVVGLMRHQKKKEAYAKFAKHLNRRIELTNLKDEEVECTISNDVSGLFLKFGDEVTRVDGLQLKQESIAFTLPCEEEEVLFKDGKRVLIHHYALQ